MNGVQKLTTVDIDNAGKCQSAVCIRRVADAMCLITWLLRRQVCAI